MSQFTLVLAALVGLSVSCATGVAQRRPMDSWSVTSLEEIPDGVREALNDSCALSGCHAGSRPAAKLDLEDVYGWLLDQTSSQTGQPLVSLGDPGSSYMWIKLQEDPPIGAQMPGKYGGGDDVEIIEAWIEWLNSW